MWLQLGIKNEEAKKLVQSKNIEYIENKCTKMEYQKYFLKNKTSISSITRLNHLLTPNFIIGG